MPPSFLKPANCRRVDSWPLWTLCTSETDSGVTRFADVLHPHDALSHQGLLHCRGPSFLFSWLTLWRNERTIPATWYVMLCRVFIDMQRLPYRGCPTTFKHELPCSCSLWPVVALLWCNAHLYIICSAAFKQYRKQQKQYWGYPFFWRPVLGTRFGSHFGNHFFMF